jgi:hypothetical protein
MQLRSSPTPAGASDDRGRNQPAALSPLDPGRRGAQGGQLGDSYDDKIVVMDGRPDGVSSGPHELTIGTEMPLLAELRVFLDYLRGGPAPRSSAAEGLLVVERLRPCVRSPGSPTGPNRRTMSPLFAILLPIIRPPLFLPMAIESVLAQSVTDFELLVICDGAPPETVACAEGYAQRDPRVKVFAHSKGARQGEAYRHSALATSTARYVAHICDDDLWMPNHLAEMDILLSAADFGNLLHVFVHPDGAIEVLPGDLGRTETRRSMCTGCSISSARPMPAIAWTLSPAARGLGARSTDVWSDLHMWRKFLVIEIHVCHADGGHRCTSRRPTPRRYARSAREGKPRVLERIRDRASGRDRAGGVALAARSIARDRSQVAALAASRDELARVAG